MIKISIKTVSLCLIALFIGLFFMLNLPQYLTLEHLKTHQETIASYYTHHKGWTLLIYFLGYTLMTALSVPGATVMTLAGGALFGLKTGVLVISFASSIGAALAFLATRHLLRDMVQNRFRDQIGTINEGIERDGGFYLFTLRLVPVFPYFLVNLAMGLTPMRLGTYYLVSQMGMLPATIVYVNAGTQLARIDSVHGILSPGLLLSFALLGFFPLLSKWILNWIKVRRIYSPWPRPQKYGYNLVVIGAGSAGLVGAYIAAALKAKVALVEARRMGGDCLNTGCVPSKAFIRSSKIQKYIRQAATFGLRPMSQDCDFREVMARVHRVIQRIAPHDSVERYTDLGIEVIQGRAEILSPFTVRVDGRILTTRSILIATGARPFIPPIPGLDRIQYLSSDTVWELKSLPKRLVILGGGPIGCELSQAFAGFGANVILVEMGSRILSREDPDVSRFISTRFEAEGIQVLTGHHAEVVRVEEDRKILTCAGPAGIVEIEFDEILVALGRAANTQGLGLETLGIPLRPNGTILTDAFLRTRFPNILASGDVAGPYQFTHSAGHQSWHAAVNALFRGIKKFRADNPVMPWCTFTDPEVARVGLNMEEARKNKIPFEVTEYPMESLDRAIADGATDGFIRILTKPGTDRILGVTIVGRHAGDIIHEFVLAMRHRLGLNKILGTVHIYPTLAEASKLAAGAWKKAHAPLKLLTWVRKYHDWLRG